MQNHNDIQFEKENMIVSKRNYFVFLSLTLSFLPGCFFNKKKSELPPLRTCVQELDGVRVVVKPLSKQECEDLFGKYTKRYQALELTIENENDFYFILHPWYIGQPLIDPKKVAQDLQTNTPLVVGGMVIAGFFGFEWLAPLSPLLYVAIPVGMWLSSRNKQITKNVNRDSVYNVESIIIPPYGQVKRHFFVSRYDFTPNFIVTLLSGQDNKPLRFPIALTQQKKATRLVS
jgi:hypothetical protein